MFPDKENHYIKGLASGRNFEHQAKNSKEKEKA